MHPSTANQDFPASEKEATDPQTGTGDGSPFARRLAHYTNVDASPDTLGSPQATDLVDGRYRMLKLIGHGSMGRIYLADQMAVGRRIALKIVNSELVTNSDILARFQQEARLLGKVQNSHVVDVYDIGETDEHDPFIAMEFIDGPSLATVIKEDAPLDPVRTMRLLLQIADALAAVHAAGVVHRDLKPANMVILRRDDPTEIVKILDFGLAKVVQNREAAGRLTRAGVVVGTPEYMSPEQVKGGTVDHRADLYSLGCTAYEMLTRSPPFVGVEMATLYKHLHEPVRPAREAAPSAGIPEALERVIAKLLAKEPGERYSSADELRLALLTAADEAGIPRRALRVERPGFEDAGAQPLPTGSDEGDDVDRWKTGLMQLPVAPPAKRRVSVESLLLLATAIIVGVIVGVFVSRRGPEAGMAPALVADPPPEAHEVLVIVTDPPGATVELDGRALPETTPTAVRGIVVGDHKVRLGMARYGTVERPVTIATGGRAALQVVLPPASRSVTVRTVPAAAAVYLDGRLISPDSPATVTLIAGEFQEIRVEKTGYEPLVKHTTPDDQESELLLTLELEKQPRGEVIVDSANVAAVWIDDNDTGLRTPTVPIRIPVGEHIVQIRDLSGAASAPARIQITQGETVRLTLHVEAAGGHKP